MLTSITRTSYCKDFVNAETIYIIYSLFKTNAKSDSKQKIRSSI